MDYTVKVRFDGGHYEEQGCATSTDVLNHIAQYIHRAVVTETAILSIEVINHTIE